ncbi:pyridoxamine 5'-phosphate oxidase [Enemella evansiae]|uniref:pyridoxamine 5'-phosphate oxidase n=1 Tax=Enemella evansiae TaxID=2016499 RepID=UPI000B96296F|nr:pyridoxamine 5'-phosphate oxidase [Enemella evansiae]OYO04841.1 pyridoxamine 5'-phosphate oxidase [Enemella evansiae]
MSRDEPADLKGLRTDYDSVRLLEDEAGMDPTRLFERWLGDALAAAERGEVKEPTAMTVATVRMTDGRPRPSARVVLLKDFGEGSFTFYTNYDSNKGNQLAENPGVAATFWWPALYRSVRIEGIVERVGAAESDAYFAVRPRGSQIAAAMSRQSHPIADADALAEAYAAAETEYAEGEVPRPPHWGGFRIVPDRIEFWQGRPSRLHDRLLFDRYDYRWRRTRLQP